MNDCIIFSPYKQESKAKYISAHFDTKLRAVSKIIKPGCFMNCCRETTKMGVPPGNRRVLVPRRT